MLHNKKCNAGRDDVVGNKVGRDDAGRDDDGVKLNCA